MLARVERYVFAYLPGALDAVPAGRLVLLEEGGQTLGSRFAYGRRYRARPHALAVDPQSLPLDGAADVERAPLDGLALFGALRDATPDTGCGLKLFEREVFLRLPYFDHMHRYLPALVRRAGCHSQSVPVGHRPRTAGVSKYGMLDRLWVGLADLRGVAWLMRRGKVTRIEEL